MKAWSHEGRLYDYVSTYSLAEDAWHHELTCRSSPGYVCVVVPDATPDDGPFTPKPAHEVVLRFADGTIPRPIWVRFMNSVGASGDIADPLPGTATGNLSPTDVDLT